LRRQCGCPECSRPHTKTIDIETEGSAVEEAAAMRDAAAVATAAAVVAAEAGIRSSMVSPKNKAEECQKVNNMSAFILLFPHSIMMF
jgi:hypothetical protein